MSSSNIIISTKPLRLRSSGFFLFSLLFFVALYPILFLFPQNVYAVDVTLAWEANSEEDLAGYKMFCREEDQSYDYDNPDKELWLTVEEGEEKEQLENPNEPSCTIHGLDDNTTYYVLARAFDEAGNESGDSNEVCYLPSGNVPPELDPIGPKTVDEGQLLEFTITASDPDGDALTYSASNLPTGASFNPATQTFNWTPGYGDTGNYDVLFSVTDDGTPALSDSETVTITVVPESNLAPLEPVITSPYYGQVECDLLLLITTGPFSDLDGDLPSQSQWQISKQEDFSSLILDVNSTEDLTKLTVPHTVLETDSTYYVRVQFYDACSESSGWSDTIEFTTTSDVNDSNTNGIPDDQEVGYDVDLNEDGIADIEQPNEIKCVQATDGSALGVSKDSNSITAIEAIEAIDPTEISEQTRRPQKLIYGFFSYRLSVDVPGATARVRVYFSKNISKAREFYKYDTISGWQDWTEYTIFNNDGRSVTLEVVDGGSGDSDGVANGVIVDPGALVEETEVETDENIGSGGDGGGGGGCFIATAAFGSNAEPHVKLLRDFRDQCLFTNTPGRWFVRMYYRYSPFWADLINIHTWCKPIVRLALMTLVGISYVLIKASVATMILSGFLLALCILGCFVRMHGRPVAGAEQR